MKDALFVLDMMNEIVRADGAWGHLGYGYGPEAERRQVVPKTALVLKAARRKGVQVVYVTVGFSETYAEWPADSPVFTQQGRDERLLQIGSWGQDIHEDVAPEPGDIRVTKRRVSPFYSTDLELILRTQRIERLLLCGVATDHVVIATARDGHDRDFKIAVFEDCCAAASQERHEAALIVLNGVGDVTTSELFLE